jgi:uncharacterized protein
MKPSSHNIIKRIRGSENYFILNLLSGNADIIDPGTASEYLSGQLSDLGGWLEKGYLSDPEKEQKLFRKKYLEFVDSRETDEVQIFFSPTYSCNFTCSYCFQDEYAVVSQTMNTKITDAFFEYIDNEFADRRKYITLFGGEPLLPGVRHRQLISYFLDQCALRNLSVAVVTNGYSIREYLPEFKKVNIREIQVTLDGVKEMHDRRRRLKNNKGTFDAIVDGINLLLENRIPVNLRMVVDKENIDNLPSLTRFAIGQGWTGNPLFKTQIGRNYELHHCQLDRSRLFSRIELYEKIYDLIQLYPEIMEFHKPAFSVSKFLFENGELPPPLFDSCPGTKTEWAFDYSGRIYACTATVGKEDEALGTFYPKVEKYADTIEEWQDRDVISIEKCRTCPLQLACGGGCAAVAKNSNGSVLSADCRPVDELLSLGISYYFEKT